VTAPAEKVIGLPEMEEYPILVAPGLVIHGKADRAGRIPTPAEVTTWLTNALA